MSDYLDIHALADGQLSGAEKSAAETRLSGCDASQREYQAVGILKDVLQSKCEPIECAETWSKCQVARVVNPGAGQGRSHLRCF